MLHKIKSLVKLAAIAGILIQTGMTQEVSNNQKNWLLVCLGEEEVLSRCEPDSLVIYQIGSSRITTIHTGTVEGCPTPILVAFGRDFDQRLNRFLTETKNQSSIGQEYVTIVIDHLVVVTFL